MARIDRSAAAVALALAVTLAGGACDWRKFDDLSKQTPVVAMGAPSGYGSSDDFGPILLPLAPPSDGSAAGRFVATGTHKTAVAIMSLDAAGQPHGVSVSGGSAFDLLAGGPVTAAAVVPGGKQVLLGAPAAAVGDVLLMNLDPPYMTTTFKELGEAQYGVGLAAGNIGGGPAPEIVVVSSTVLHVYSDFDGTTTPTDHTLAASAAATCQLDFSTLLPDRDRVNRPVIIGPLQATGTQIAVGTPSVSGAGHVAIFNFDATTGEITCAASLTATEAHFGVSMALVDLEDPPGQPDHLLVGAPPTHAYLYALPISDGQAPSAMATEAMAGGDFGARVAAFDLDGQPGDEMLVGNPDATVGGATSAGRVTIYKGASMTMLPSTAMIPNPLALNEPKGDDGYGSGIASTPFCPGAVVSGAGDGGVTDGGVMPCASLPLVGSLSKVYGYYTLKKPDPRVK